MVFLHLEKNRDYCIILNDYVEYQHFKMETIQDILAAVVLNSAMVVAHLQDYLVVPISKWYWRFLKFR